MSNSIYENNSTKCKFHREISCIHCRTVITTQSFKSHLKKHIPKKNCPQCNTGIFYTEQKFCSHKCAAVYTNKRKDFKNIKKGNFSYTRIVLCHVCDKYYQVSAKLCFHCKSYNPKKIKICKICQSDHVGTGLTCSLICKSKYLSIKMLERIDLGWNPQQNRCRSKASYLEKSFENWLNTKEIFNFIKNKTFRCGEKVYFGDFFFPEKKLLIELDGKQHLKTIEYDIERDNLILKHHGVKTIRISYDEYVSRSKIDLIYQLLK